MNKTFRFRIIEIFLALYLILLIQNPITAQSIKSHFGMRLADKIVAVVNDDVVTFRELEQCVQLSKFNLLKKYHSLKSVPSTDKLRGHVLDQIIINHIQMQKARDDNIDVDNKVVKIALQLLSKKKGISLSQYKSHIESQGLSWNVFVRNLYIDLVISELRKFEVDSKINVSNEEISDYMAKKHSILDTMKIVQTQVRHILLIAGKDSSEEIKLRKKLLDIRKQFLDGANFSELARKYSQDSSSLNGYLGWIQPGETIPEFEHAMNTLKEGEISQPVQTRYGYHLIQVLGRCNVNSSIQQKEEIVRLIIGQKKSNQAYIDWLHNLRDSSYIKYNLDDLDKKYEE